MTTAKAIEISNKIRGNSLSQEEADYIIAHINLCVLTRKPEDKRRPVQ